MNVQSILLRRYNKILVPAIGKKLSLATVAAFNLNLQNLGYTLSPEAIKALSVVSDNSSSNIPSIFSDILHTLKELKGVRNYRPMYPNFPKQVMEASDAELYINAILHYFSFALVDLTGDPDMIWLPKYKKDEREPLDEKVELRVINLATNEDLDALTAALATSNTSLSATDKDDLKALIISGLGRIHEILPNVRNKENLAYIGALLCGTLIDITPYFKTATDVLRLATALSDGDVSLKDNTKYRSFNGKTRRTLLSLLEGIQNKEEDMLRHAARWVRLGERLHPGDYPKRFPTTLKAFTALRRHERIETHRSRVEQVVREGNTLQSILLLSQRPGDFARRLDHVLRQATGVNVSRVVKSFLGVASEVSTPVLLQVMAHFSHRHESSDLRVVFPKGNIAKVMALENTLSPLSSVVTGELVDGVKGILINRFAGLAPLGKVYLDPDLKDCLVPFSQRSASKSLRTLVRGSKLSFTDEKNFIRFFIWWHDMKGDKTSKKEYEWGSYDNNRVDLDLSASAYDSDWNSKGAITYYHLREQYAWHSGDITSAPQGASEFIDVDIRKALKQNIRYIVMTVHGFTSQNFCDLPECFAGFMLREKPQSGEIYDPRTVEDKADLTTEARSGIPMIIDLVDRKVIWADIAISDGQRQRFTYHNVATQRGTIELMGRALTNLKKPNLYDLLSLHVAARGSFVLDEDEADVVFSVKNGTPFQLEKIASEFMVDAEKPNKAASASA